MATASPTWRALSAGSSIWGPSNTFAPPGPASFISNLVDGTGVWGMGLRPSARQSAPDSTASTPGKAKALAPSTFWMRAWG